MNLFHRTQLLFASLVLACLPAWAEQDPDTVVICPDSLQPALTKWREYRESQGHRLRFVTPTADFAETRDRMIQATGPSTRFAVLVGCAETVRSADLKSFVPTGLIKARINTRWGSEATLATDRSYGDLGTSGEAMLAVGRLPFTSADQLQAYCQRVIAYEQATPLMSEEHRLTLVASPGNFSPMIDGLVETTATRVLQDVTPPACDLHFTYADWRSPYCPFPPSMPRVVRQGLERRSLAWVYLGHGLHRQLDVLRTPQGSAAILDNRLASKLKAKRPPPLAVLLACYAGAFDGSTPCLAEAMLSATGGPPAVLASSRVSMPYGNTVLGLELLTGLFQGAEPTLGGLVAAAKERSLRPAAEPSPGNEDATSRLRTTIELIAGAITPDPQDRIQERREHAQMYNLLGDPLLKLDRPQVLHVDAKWSEEMPRQVVVQGRSPMDGPCTVRLVNPRGAGALRGARNEFAISQESANDYAGQYSQANNRTVVKTECDCQAGTFEATLDVPQGQPIADLTVIGFVNGSGGYAVGHAPVP